MLVRANRRPHGAVIILAAILLVGGCGKDDGERAAETPQRYVPRNVGSADAPAETAAIDTTAARTVAPETAAAAQASAPEAAGTPAEPPAATLSPADRSSEPAATAPRPPDAARAPAAGGPFSLQLGSFRRLDNARVLMDKVKAAGYDPVLESVVLGGQTYHRVLLKGLADRAAASRTGEVLRKQLGVTYLVRRSD